MKYFLDQEFHERMYKPLFGKSHHIIELISIGIVAEDGREYYALCKEFDLKAAWKNSWLRDNVLLSIYKEHFSGDSRNRNPFTQATITMLLAKVGKTKAQIANDVLQMVAHHLGEFIQTYTRHDCWAEHFYPKEFRYIRDHNTEIPARYYSSGVDGKGYERNAKIIFNKPQFYGYFADYDWVLFCSLFGSMMNLPKGFPMYCNDLKQTLDEKAVAFFESVHPQGGNLEERVTAIKSHPAYPKQQNEHNALADAKWNKALYGFLNSALDLKPTPQ